MKIAVEGNVHSGKTTFISKFVLENPEYKIVPECLFDASLGDYERQLFYIAQERQKKLDFSGEENTIQDRSILSTLCYTLFMTTISNEQKQELIKTILDGINSGEFIIPDKIYFVKCKADIVASNHKVLKAEKGTQDVLATTNYLDFYNAQFEKWLSSSAKESEISSGDRVITIFDAQNLFKNLEV
ncbi:MAG: hypothetical protein E7341_03055 [Clostridiales bacterium]|nr:hypothetical protein [Clostridiales bacterium]